jgi:hypothetical protein
MYFCGGSRTLKVQDAQQRITGSGGPADVLSLLSRFGKGASMTAREGRMEGTA